MNPLIDKFPTKIKVGNEIIDINCDFRNCIEIVIAYEDSELTIGEKHYIMLCKLYKTMPENIEEGIKKGLRFLDCGEERKESNSESKRLYSFKKDAKYIYSAISQTKKINLENIDFLHWWDFCYSFLEIGKDSVFSNILTVRERKNKGKLSKEEKKFYIENRDILDLDYENVSEEESEFMKAFNEGDEARKQ